MKFSTLSVRAEGGTAGELPKSSQCFFCAELPCKKEQKVPCDCLKHTAQDDQTDNEKLLYKLNVLSNSENTVVYFPPFLDLKATYKSYMSVMSFKSATLNSMLNSFHFQHSDPPEV